LPPNPNNSRFRGQHQICMKVKLLWSRPRSSQLPRWQHRLPNENLRKSRRLSMMSHDSLFL
jgi:hypothetical protein